MNLLFPAQHLELSMRALKTIALADGTFDDMERRLMVAGAAALGAEIEPDALEPAQPEEVADVIEDAETRTRLIQTMMILAMMDGEVTRPEQRAIQRFADALKVDDRRLKNMKNIVGGHMRLVKLDLIRRSPVFAQAISKAQNDYGKVRGIWKVVGGFKGLTKDDDLAWRYRRLGLLPEGTLGREYWAHMTEGGYYFPGERGGFPEGLVKHDLCHIIGEYGTDPIGECEIVAFVCGFMKTDPFWYLFLFTAHWHAGVEIVTDTPSSRGIFEPELLINALKRGSQVNTDLYSNDIDWWPLYELPVEEVRRKFDVPPP